MNERNNNTHILRPGCAAIDISPNSGEGNAPRT